ncbi:MAG: ATP-dependent Clp protease proteolytic subunit [Syntrophobacteraceae bacterium]
MKKNKQTGLSVEQEPAESSAVNEAKVGQESQGECAALPEQEAQIPEPPPWHIFIQDGSDEDIKQRFSAEVNGILLRHLGVLNNYCVLGIMDWKTLITQWDLDQIYGSIKVLNPDCKKDILLILYSPGGNIEPGYQISKLCKLFSKNKFVAAVPRQAKSAATLIAIGADEIHMGLLGQLGPIDPQLGNLPALGVSQALQTIASLSERFPKSSDMFAKYLHMAVTVEQIGYYERISESAVQYAERLLSTKLSLPKAASTIAKELVHEYKDHGFVIDIEEARQHLGNEWILASTPEISAAEEIYSLINIINIWLDFYNRKKRILVSGDFTEGVYMW